MKELTYAYINEDMRADVLEYLKKVAIEGSVYMPRTVLAKSLPHPISRTSLYHILHSLEYAGEITLEGKKITLVDKNEHTNS